MALVEHEVSVNLRCSQQADTASSPTPNNLFSVDPPSQCQFVVRIHYALPEVKNEEENSMSGMTSQL